MENANILKRGTRVQHESGWMGIVNGFWWGPFEILIKADDPKLSGYYSPIIFTVVPDEEETCASL